LRHFEFNYLTAFALLVSLCCFGAQADAETSEQSQSNTPVIVPVNTSSASSDGIIDIRLRPLAAVQGITGLELGFALNSRLELGPAVHYFSGTNDIRFSDVNTWEIGLKATYLVYSPAIHEGAYISAAAYDYISQVGSFSPAPDVSTAHFNTFGATLTAGYQWDLGLFHSDAWTVRTGAGLGYKQPYIEELAVPGGTAPYGVVERLDPTLEFTLGVWL
jgi:hypothetical protein